MRSVVQRVASARVSIGGEVTATIGPGLLILVGVQRGDAETDAHWLARKIAGLRIFADADGRMNQSLVDPSPGMPVLERQALVVSQFTLLASTRKGTRPSFNDAAPPDAAVSLYDAFIRELALALGRPVATGTFGAMMQVELVNDGPVTLVLDSRLRE